MILGVLMARLNSTRLPAKALLAFGNSTLVGYVFDILKASRVDKAVLCTPDRFLNAFVDGDCCVWSGERDIIAELLSAADIYHADHIVRVTADCPFLTCEAINTAIEEHIKSGSEYTYNGNDIIGPDTGDGQNVEIVSLEALKKLDRLSGNREHLISENILNSHYIKPDGDFFSVNTLEEYIKAYLLMGGLRNGSTSERRRSSVGKP